MVSQVARHAAMNSYSCPHSAVHVRSLTPLTSIRFTAAALLSFPIIVMAILHSVAAHLDHATRRQCATHDWPVERHAAHMEFCRTYGYFN